MWQAVCINLLRVFIGSMNWMSYVSHLTPNICSTVSCKTINIYLMLIVFSWNYFSISSRLMQQFHRKVKVEVVLISRLKRFFERFHLCRINEYNCLNFAHFIYRIGFRMYRGAETCRVTILNNCGLYFEFIRFLIKTCSGVLRLWNYPFVEFRLLKKSLPIVRNIDLVIRYGSKQRLICQINLIVTPWLISPKNCFQSISVLLAFNVSKQNSTVK